MRLRLSRVWRRDTRHRIVPARRFGLRLPARWRQPRPVWSSAENPTVIEPSCAVALRVPSIVGPLGLSPTNIIHPTLTAKSSKKTSRPTGGAGASCTRIVYKAARTRAPRTVVEMTRLVVLLRDVRRGAWVFLVRGAAAAAPRTGFAAQSATARVAPWVTAWVAGRCAEGAPSVGFGWSGGASMTRM